MNNWIYHGSEFISIIDTPTDSIGFIYLISHTTTNRKYIGRKLLYKTSYKTVNKKRKKIKIESDWKEYWSSSPQIHEIIEKEGYDNLQREILIFVNSKASLNYSEEKLQYSLGVLESDNWINSNIRSKQYKKWITNFKNLNELNSVLNRLHQDS